MADVPLPSLAATAAMYQTQVSQSIPPASVWTRLLPADPRRYYVRFAVSGLGTTFPILPAPAQKIAPTGVGGGLGASEYKWKDCPSMVAGEWYCVGDGASFVTVVTCTYIGE